MFANKKAADAAFLEPSGDDWSDRLTEIIKAKDPSFTVDAKTLAPWADFKDAIQLFPLKQLEAKTDPWNGAITEGPLLGYDDDVVESVMRYVFLKPGAKVVANLRVPIGKTAKNTQEVDLATVSAAKHLENYAKGSATNVNLLAKERMDDNFLHYPPANGVLAAWGLPSKSTPDTKDLRTPSGRKSFATALKSVFCKKVECDGSTDEGVALNKIDEGPSIQYFFRKDPEVRNEKMSLADMSAFASKFIKLMQSEDYGKPTVG